MDLHATVAWYISIVCHTFGQILNFLSEQQKQKFLKIKNPSNFPISSISESCKFKETEVLCSSSIN